MPILEETSVSGRVIDATSGAPIEGARVTARPTSGKSYVAQNGRTDADGRFDLRLQLCVGVAGRSELIGSETKPLPPRLPLAELLVETPDGRSVARARPAGRYTRTRDDDRLVYRVGTIAVPGSDGDGASSR